LIRLAGMEIELGHLLRRRVEIHPQKGINPRFKEEVIQQAQVQYEGA
jgi:predicted nucleotidyltransferase